MLTPVDVISYLLISSAFFINSLNVMKKIYAMTVGIALATGALAQINEGFESFTLEPESYDNGSAGGGDFVFSGVTFSNYYNSDWSSFNGFAVSNMTNDSTAGYGNQYSAYTGSGANSENYLVFYPDGTITAESQYFITGFKITNTAYAAIAMRDGDSFAKQFGSIYAADGSTVDGTNGEDYFRVWVIYSNADETSKDSLEFYLADYRFANNSEDYIVDQWEQLNIPVASFAPEKIKFRFESSDVGAWGINTPLYFAIDDVSYDFKEGIGENILTNVSVAPNPMANVVRVKGESGKIVIYNMNGEKIKEADHNNYSVIDVSDLNSGVYFLELTNENGSFRQKLIK